MKLEVRSHAPGALPELVRAGLPERGGPGAGLAGRIVQLDGSVVHVELDPALAERGVVLCSLEEALRDGDERAREHFSKRLTYDRHKLEAANAAFWTGGAYLYVPPGVAVAEPFEIVYAIEDAGVAQYGRSLVVGDRASDFRVHEHNLAGIVRGPVAARGGVRAVPARRRPLPWRRCRTGARRGLRRVDALRRRRPRRVLPLAAVTARWAAVAPAPGAGGVRARRRHGVSRPVLHRGSGASRRVRGGPARDGAIGRDVHWRGAATGESRSSFEGLIQIDPGAQQTHTYLQIHTMMLSPKARLDAIPSVLVSADDVSASHGGTVGELDESAIFYMQSRGLDRRRRCDCWSRASSSRS